LKESKLLAVDDDPEILQVLEKEILEACPNCRFDKATGFGPGLAIRHLWLN
jgi:hypothetical protein